MEDYLENIIGLIQRGTRSVDDSSYALVSLFGYQESTKSGHSGHFGSAVYSLLFSRTRNRCP